MATKSDVEKARRAGFKAGARAARNAAADLLNEMLQWHDMRPTSYADQIRQMDLPVCYPDKTLRVVRESVNKVLAEMTPEQRDAVRDVYGLELT